MKHSGGIFQYLKYFVPTVFTHLLFPVNVQFLRLTGMYIHSKLASEMHVHVTMETECWTQKKKTHCWDDCGLSPAWAWKQCQVNYLNSHRATAEVNDWQKLLCWWPSEGKNTICQWNNLKLQQVKEVYFAFAW